MRWRSSDSGKGDSTREKKNKAHYWNAFSKRPIDLGKYVLRR